MENTIMAYFSNISEFEVENYIQAFEITDSGYEFG